MPNEILTEDRFDIVQAGGYHAFDYIVLCPNTVVFAAHVNGTPASSVFASLAFDTVTTGVYTAALEGMVVLVSHTNDMRAAFFRGRVRKPPTSTILYINQDSPAIVDNDYVWVIDSYDVVEKKRNRDYVDFEIAYQGVAPIVKGMQSAYAVLTTATSAQLSFAPVGQAMTKSATIASYAWSIPGATYNTGSSSTQNITVTIPEGHRWGRLTLTDSNGVTNWFAFQIIIGDPDTDSFFHLCHEPPDIEAGLETGYSASVEYWQGVENVLDRTRAVVVTDEYYAAGDPEFNNVRFIGYMAKDASSVRGDEKWGQLKDVRIDLQGFLPLAGEITFDAIVVTYIASPSLWNEMNIPTPQRVVSHVFQRHSTLFNLCACNFGTVDDTYFSGDFDVQGGGLVTAAQHAAGRINAILTQDAAGQLWFTRNANFLSVSDRNALEDVTPTAIDLGQAQKVDIDHPHIKRVGSITVDFKVYNTLTNTQYSIKGVAPSSGVGEGQEHNDIEGQLLAVESEVGASLEEARQRAGDWYEYTNPVDTMTIDLDDGYGWLSPSANQWFTFDIPAADLPRGMAVTSSDRWLLTRVSTQLSDRGTRVVNAAFRRESRGGAANIDVSIVPAATDTELNVVPLMPSYGGAFAPAASINYDSKTPSKQHPFSASDLGQTGPMTAEQGAMETSSTSNPGEVAFAISFANSANVGAGFPSVNGEPYIITAAGSAAISGAAWTHTFFPSDDGGFVQNPTYPYGVYNAPDWEDTDGFAVGFYRRSIDIVKTGFASTTFKSFSLNYDLTMGTYLYPVASAAEIGATLIWVIDYTDLTTGTNLTETWTGTEIGTSLRVAMNSSVSNTASYSGDVVFNSLTVTGEGTNPFTGAPSTLVHADAFYQWEEGEDGEPTNVSLLGTGAGLYIQNATAGTPPPFDAVNHSYTFAYTGDGNILQFRFMDSDYTDNANLPMQITISGLGAGS